MYTWKYYKADIKNYIFPGKHQDDYINALVFTDNHIYTMARRFYNVFLHLDLFQ